MSRFIAPFMQFFAKATDAPFSFGEASALMTISTIALGRRELAYGEGIKPNLFCMLVGDSSVARKSTAVKFAKKFTTEVDDQRVGPRDYTVEGLIKWMQQKDPATSKTRNKVALFAEEFGADLARMEAYASTMTADFCALYDGDTFEKARASSGVTRVERPRVNLFAACAYHMLAKYIRPRDWLSGYMMRFIFVAPSEMRPQEEIQPLFPHPEYQQAVVSLKTLRDDLNAQHVALQLDPAALAYYRQEMKRFNHHLKTLGPVQQTYQARFGVNVLKLSLLYQLDVDPFSYVTQLAVQQAFQFAFSTCWPSFIEAYNRTAMGEFESLFTSVYETLRVAGPMTRLQLAQRYWGNELLDRVVTYMKAHNIVQTPKTSQGEQIALTETWQAITMYLKQQAEIIRQQQQQLQN